MSSSRRMLVRKPTNVNKKSTALLPRTRATVSVPAQGSLAARLQNKAYRHAYVTSHLTQGIAHQIRIIREQCGLTQEELAERANTTQTIVCRLEDPSYGRFTMKTLLRIAESLDIALLVKFVSFPKFLYEISDKSPHGLYAASYEETNAQIPFLHIHSPAEHFRSLFVSNALPSLITNAEWHSFKISARESDIIDVTPSQPLGLRDHIVENFQKRFSHQELISIEVKPYE